MVERAMLAMQQGELANVDRCGVVADALWRKFTLSRTGGALDGHSKTTRLSVAGQLQLKPDSWTAVGLTFSGLGVDHQLVFIVTPTGRAHTLQSFFPLIRRPHYFSVNVANLKGALNAFVTETKWTDKYCAAFNELTHISQAQRFMEDQDGIEGFVMAPRPLEGARQVGLSYLSHMKDRGTPAAAPRILVADIPNSVANAMMLEDVPEEYGGGASRRSRPKKWISTGRQTTLKDGSKRTVYRAVATGARATKRMVARNGKTFARYVELSTRQKENAVACLK
jgi:hypothetical protein